MEILRGILLVLFIILLGVFMLKAASWGRKRNDQLQKSGEDSQDEIIEKALNGGSLKTAITNFLASSVSKSDEIQGKVLAIAVILFVVTFFLFVAYKSI